MGKQTIITGIDLGTDKCTTIIAGIDGTEEKLTILGVSSVPAIGMKKSQIVDLEAVLRTVTESLDAAERMAGLSVRSAYVSISGPHITTKNSKGVVAVTNPNQEISSSDVERVLEAARAVALPPDQEIIHVVPRDFSVDAQHGIKDPVGMTGIRLEAEVHIVSGLTTALRNIEKCLQDVGISVDGFVFSGLASSEACLTETEKELGVVMLDIGSGTSSISAFVEGSLAFSGAIPIGARHITQDIALGCRVSLDAAEKIKLALAKDPPVTVTPKSGETKADLLKRRKVADVLDVKKLGVHEGIETLSKKKVVEGIMVPRMKEIFSLVGKELHKHEVLKEVPAGLVISGGGAKTIGITEVAKRTLNLPARVAKPQQIKGIMSDIHDPAYATSIGLLLYGHAIGGGAESGQSISISLGKMPNLSFGSLGSGIIKTISRITKSILP